MSDGIPHSPRLPIGETTPTQHAGLAGPVRSVRATAESLSTLSHIDTNKTYPRLHT